MRIIASDFDGTITHRGVTPELRAAIAEWRAAGNLFGIVTGRPYASIRQALDAAKLEADFTVSDNGALAFDKAGNCTHALVIPPEDVVAGHRILREFDCDLYRLSCRTTYAIGTGMPELKYDKESGFVYSDAVAMRDVTEFFARFKSAEDCETAKKAIEEGLGGRVRGTSSSPVTSDFMRGDAFKSKGIEKYVNECGLEPEKIYTIGDAFNDLDMLIYPAFEGYAVNNAMAGVREAVGRSVDSPLELLRMIT